VAPSPEAEDPPPDFPVPLHSEPPGEDGDVSRAFVTSDGERLILNGVNMFPVIGASRPWGREDYEDIADKGFTAVRFLLRWSDFEPQPGRFQNLELLDQAVSEARDAGLYVVLLNIIVDDWNRPPAWAMDRDNLEQITTGAKAWTQELARRYKDEDAVAAYDLAAELPSSDQNRVLSTYSTLIEWVREVDRDKIVITTAGWGNSEMSHARVDPDRLGKDRRNVVHSYHDYYAGDGDPGRVSVGYNELGMNSGNQVWDGVSGYPNPGDAADFAAQLEHQSDYARRAGVALWIGEYGINPSLENSATWVEQKTELYDRAGLGRAWWLYTCGENFGLKDPSCNWRPVADALTQAATFPR
jgi:Cellulase (glycosyl hydrolase family 5)